MEHLLNVLVFSRIPTALRKHAADMIISMLQSNPDKRPSVGKLFSYEFIKSHFIPDSLPASCLTMAPRGDQVEGGSDRFISSHPRKALIELNESLSEYINYISLKLSHIII